RRHEDRRKDDLGGIKIKVPSFQGKSDPETYLEWEMHVNQISSHQSYLEGKNVKLAYLKFTNYALVWWDQIELNNKFHCLSQGSKSVDDYHKEMEMTIIRANILED
ncbi:hypothetical protein CR513_24262, partial [Mucuna pruriens]